MYASQWQAMRGFSRDPSVTKQRLKPGTVRRIAGYARPYRLDLAIFLLAAALDAVVTVSYPILLGLIIDKGILPKRTDVVLGARRCRRRAGRVRRVPQRSCSAGSPRGSARA